jgi:hypothetical protein
MWNFHGFLQKKNCPITSYKMNFNFRIFYFFLNFREQIQKFIKFQIIFESVFVSAMVLNLFVLVESLLKFVVVVDY